MKTLAAALLLLASCKTLAPVEQQLLDCGSASAGALLSQEVATVEQDLATGTWNAQSLLNTALSELWPDRGLRRRGCCSGPDLGRCVECCGPGPG